MTEAPQFLEFSVPCPDVAESLAWYQQLGFAELLTGDMRTSHYAVVTDGDFCIGLYENDYPAPGLSFVQENLSSRVRPQLLAETPFVFARLGEDEFHEAALTDPYGTLAILLEARTFSGTINRADTPLTGCFSHVALPCMQIQNSIVFWRDYGFIAVTSEGQEHAELHTPGLLVQLVPDIRAIELHFKPADREGCIRSIETLHSIRQTRAGHELIAPEGTRIIVS